MTAADRDPRPAPIHVIEPTLRDRTGHCFSALSALLGANGERLPIEAWVGREAGPLLAGAPCVVHPHFRRRWRRPQLLLLLRRLLREPGRLYLSTASRGDLVLVDLAARGPVPPDTVFLLFHWLRPTASRRRSLARLALRQPEVVPLATSAPVAELLRGCGFRRAAVAPYPVAAPRRGPAEAPFRHLLFGGAARLDKGFAHVVALAAHLARTGSDLPLLVQTSPPEKGVHEPAVRDLLERLEAERGPGLRLVTATLDAEAYTDQFRGAVSLQLYDPAEYARGRISGVTLDALCGGSPVIATAGTWMADLVRRFDAGVALEELSPAAVLGAAERIVADWPAYRDRALAAGAALAEEHDPARVLEIIAGRSPAPGPTAPQGRL